jgi:hypothetical protein
MNISNDTHTIIIRHCEQDKNKIQTFEDRANQGQHKLIWILSLKCIKYDSIFHNNGKIYISFVGSSNYLPYYDSNISTVYLDTGSDILIKVVLDNFNNFGQEVQLICLQHFCEEYDELLVAYPYRRPDTYLHTLQQQQQKYITRTHRLVDQYHKQEKQLASSNQLSDLLKLLQIYKKIPKTECSDQITFAYKKQYRLYYKVIQQKVAELQDIYKTIADQIKNRTKYDYILHFSDATSKYIFKKAIEYKACHKQLLQQVQSFESSFIIDTHKREYLEHDFDISYACVQHIYKHIIRKYLSKFVKQHREMKAKAQHQAELARQVQLQKEIRAQQLAKQRQRQ